MNEVKYHVTPIHETLSYLPFYHQYSMVIRKLEDSLFRWNVVMLHNINICCDEKFSDKAQRGLKSMWFDRYGSVRLTIPTHRSEQVFHQPALCESSVLYIFITTGRKTVIPTVFLFVCFSKTILLQYYNISRTMCLVVYSNETIVLITSGSTTMSRALVLTVSRGLRFGHFVKVE